MWRRLPYFLCLGMGQRGANAKTLAMMAKVVDGTRVFIKHLRLLEESSASNATMETDYSERKLTKMTEF
jgi:hypothetical protein